MGQSNRGSDSLCVCVSGLFFLYGKRIIQFNGKQFKRSLEFILENELKLRS